MKRAAGSRSNFKLLRFFLVLALVCLLAPSSTFGSEEKMTKETALQKALAAAGGFLGTWVETVQKGDHWYVTAISKSAHPPVTYILSGASNKILFAFDNADVAELQGVATNGPGGAAIVLEENVLVAYSRLNTWPDAVLGKLVGVTGVLKKIPGAESKPLEFPLLEVRSNAYSVNGMPTEFEYLGKSVSEKVFQQKKASLKLASTFREGERTDGYTMTFDAKDNKGMRFEYSETVTKSGKKFSIRKK